MAKGTFINFYLPYSNGGVRISPQEQAKTILTKARELIANGAKGVGITYSANYGQTREIERIYFAGGWNTQTMGANQADVICSMESLMLSEYDSLQGKVHILPITTMNAYSERVERWNEDVQLGIVTTDLDRIRIYLESGWYILGWQNQSTIKKPTSPYAVGGGIAHLPDIVKDKIQTTLIEFAEDYDYKSLRGNGVID